ncbi:hypothetical protein [Halobacillus naozhouensis]|uniref:Aldehyde dehydrogenase family protein n=1 Tax=Halobacillus naozhouensis TaxID=554880 RepID=A0ABY8IZ04_9BACI|nr:hypothetical protein [Halobacillus naozhouensis]WFT75438.1 hypothetical protein P9989_03295 [Halobacillus naozhouensis]
MSDVRLADVNEVGKKVISEIHDVQLYIDGEFVDAESKEQFDNVNPFTNEKINQVASGVRILKRLFRQREKPLKENVAIFH